MKLWNFFRKFSLPCSLVIGAVGYLIFAYVPFLEPLGDAVGPHLVSLMPVVLFALLYVTFCKIEIKEMKPKAWHFILQLIRTSLALMMVVLIFEFGNDYNTKLILEGAFICFICPTAAAVAVVTEKLGGSIGSLTTYTVIANIFTMVIIPSLFPMVEKGADVSFLYMSLMVFRNVTTVLVVPLLLALLSRRFLPKFVDKVKSVKDLGFYMWCFNLTILMGETVRNILHATVSGWILVLLLIVPLFVCLIQFAIGKAVGRHTYARIENMGCRERSYHWNPYRQDPHTLGTFPSLASVRSSYYSYYTHAHILGTSRLEPDCKDCVYGCYLLHLGAWLHLRQPALRHTLRSYDTRY